MLKCILDILQPALPGLVVALFAPFLAVHLAIRRFHKERWWERKHEAYSSLLEGLHDLKDNAEEWFQAETDPDNTTDQKLRELKRDLEKFSREFARRRDLASLYISPDAVAVLDKYVRKKAQAQRSKSIFLCVDAELAAARECLEELKEAAKGDLQVK